MTHDVKRAFADIDADHGNCAVEFLRHGRLLDLGRPLSLSTKSAAHVDTLW